MTVLCKSMLIIAIILAIIALVTPNWQTLSGNGQVFGQQLEGDVNIGLCSICVDGNWSGSGDTYKDHKCYNMDNSGIVTARNLIITSIVLLIFGLIMQFISEKDPNNKIFKVIGMGFYILGLILMISGIIIFMGNDLQKNPLPNLTKLQYGFSYYLAIVSVVLILGSGICNFVHKNK